MLVASIYRYKELFKFIKEVKEKEKGQISEEALKLIVKSIQKAGFKNGIDFSICLDVAANELYKNKKYSIHSKKFISTDETINKYLKLIRKYKIR